MEKGGGDDDELAAADDEELGRGEGGVSNSIYLFLKVPVVNATYV